MDALCKRYEVDNSNRDLHGALLDSQLLAQVYLIMTGGQASLFAGDSKSTQASTAQSSSSLQASRQPLRVIRATADELKAHQEIIDQM